MVERVDCVVIGAGVVGLGIARALALRGREVLVLEAQRAIGMGTSSRNSEVIHAGIYYASGSYKASLCVIGREALYEYCRRFHIEHRRLGKLIVATSESQIPELHSYARQAAINGVTDLRFCSQEEVQQLEPDVRCVAGLLSPSTGIVDSHGLMLAYQAELEAHGGTLVLNSRVLGGKLHTAGITLQVEGTSVYANTVVNAGGLDAQSISLSLGGLLPATVPELFLAKGHYFNLVGRSPFSRLVYPIAEAAGLGIHVTLDLGGRARFGPDVQWTDSLDYSFDLNRRGSFAAAVSRYYPALDESRLEPGFVGIRPKIADKGQAAADFCIRGPADHGGAPYVALYGIESPGLTASLALGDHVAGVAQSHQ